jgi:hypothetical protein
MMNILEGEEPGWKVQYGFKEIFWTMGMDDICFSELGDNHGVVGQAWASFFSFELFTFTPIMMDRINSGAHLCCYLEIQLNSVRQY